MSVKKMGIWIGGLSKADSPDQCEWVSSNPLRVWIEQKGGGKSNSLYAQLLSLGHWSSSPAVCAPGP